MVQRETERPGALSPCVVLCRGGCHTFPACVHWCITHEEEEHTRAGEGDGRASCRGPARPLPCPVLARLASAGRGALLSKILVEALHLESNGGMWLKNRGRRRTLCGTFLQL